MENYPWSNTENNLELFSNEAVFALNLGIYISQSSKVKEIYSEQRIINNELVSNFIRGNMNHRKENDTLSFSDSEDKDTFINNIYNGSILALRFEITKMILRNVNSRQGYLNSNFGNLLIKIGVPRNDDELNQVLDHLSSNKTYYDKTLDTEVDGFLGAQAFGVVQGIGLNFELSDHLNKKISKEQLRFIKERKIKSEETLSAISMGWRQGFCDVITGLDYLKSIRSSNVE